MWILTKCQFLASTLCVEPNSWWSVVLLQWQDKSFTIRSSVRKQRINHSWQSPWTNLKPNLLWKQTWNGWYLRLYSSKISYSEPTLMSYNWKTKPGWIHSRDGKTITRTHFKSCPKSHKLLTTSASNKSRANTVQTNNVSSASSKKSQNSTVLSSSASSSSCKHSHNSTKSNECEIFSSHRNNVLQSRRNWKTKIPTPKRKA